MNARKLAVQCAALVIAYALACSDVREFFRHPAQSPARTVRARAASGPPQVSEPRLSVEQVATVLHAVIPSLRASCGRLVPPNLARASAAVSMQLSIEADGNVSRLGLEGASMDSELASCVARGVEPLRFPDAVIASHLTVSLAFDQGIKGPKLELWTTPKVR